MHRSLQARALLVERFIAPKVLEVSRQHWLDDQTAFEALVRFTDEELKHQEMFRRMERLAAEHMPAGYSFLPQPNDVAAAVLSKSTWPDAALSAVWKDVFTHHAREESQHAILDELEWMRENGNLTPAERNQGVDDLIALVGAVDGIVQMQAKSDAAYFKVLGGMITAQQGERIGAALKPILG